MYLAFKFPSKSSAYLLPKIATFRWSEHKNIPHSGNEKLSIFGFFVETIGLANCFISVFSKVSFFVVQKKIAQHALKISW